MKENEQPTVPRWLTDLQQRSWEPEILLSGIVLFGMFRVPGLLDDFLLFFKLNIYGNMQDIDNLVSLFKVGVYWLILGLVLHLICRGIWIGMVGLSYAFPEGIRVEKLKYQERFQQKVRKSPAYEEIVIRLEKLCSALFSLSFMLFMSLIGGYLFLFVLIIAPFLIGYTFFDIGLSGAAFQGFQIYVIIVLIIGVIGLIDFLSLGYLRRFYWFARLYWPVHVVISFLTLSRFYRAIYYGMVTNYNRWAFFTLLVLFTVSSLFGSGAQSASYYPGDIFSRLQLWESNHGDLVFSGHYMDQNQDKPSYQAQIPSDVITGEVLRLFVVANIQNEDNILEHTPLDSLGKQYPDYADTGLKLMAISNFYEVRLDDQPVEIDQWFFHYNSHTSQRGYLTYLPLADLSVGMHKVKLLGADGSYYATIPFYKQ